VVGLSNIFSTWFSFPIFKERGWPDGLPWFRRLLSSKQLRFSMLISFFAKPSEAKPVIHRPCRLSPSLVFNEYKYIKQDLAKLLGERT